METFSEPHLMKLWLLSQQPVVYESEAVQMLSDHEILHAWKGVHGIIAYTKEFVHNCEVLP